MYSTVEKKMMIQEDEYKQYMDATTTGVIYFDGKQHIKNLNAEAERICSIPKSLLLGKSAKEAFASFGKCFLQFFSLTEEKEIRSTTTYANIDGKQVYLHLNMLKIMDSAGNITGNVLVMQDVSAMRAALKQIQTTKMLMSLGELAAGVAHHVRTPLTTISGYLQLMMGRLEDDKYTVKRDVLEGLLGEVSYINNVVKELVMFAKPAIVKKPAVDINAVLNDALLLTFNEFGSEGIQISRQIVKGMPTITGDSSFLQQALMNILQNALEAMGDTGTLTVKTWRDYESNMIVVSIADTGSGVAKEILPRVFEPFYTTKLDRMGLGLPIAHRIITEHGGFINLLLPEEDSSGTVIRVYLPLIENKSKSFALVQQQVLNLQ